MSIIFNIKDIENWAEEINSELKNDFPEYYAQNPIVGSELWWQETEFELQNGKITHVGEIVDEDGALLDVVTIQPLDKDFNGDYNGGAHGQPEYELYREDFWLNPTVQKDKLVQITSTTIYPSGELDENSIYIEIQVKVW